MQTTDGSPRFAPLVVGFGMVAAVTVVVQASNFAVTAVVARKVGPENYGAYAFALTVARYVALPAGLGVALLAMRDIARAPDQLRRIVGEVLAIQIAILCLTVAVLFLAAPIISINDETRTLIPIVALTVVALTLNLEWMLQAKHRFGTIALSRLGPQIVFVVLVLVLISPGFQGTVTFAWLTLVSAGLAALLIATVAVRSFGRPIITLRPSTLWRRYRRGLTIGVSLLMVEVFYSIDFLILGILEGTDEVGQYYAAYRIPLALITVAALWVTVFFTQAATLYVENRQALRNQVERSLQLAVAVAFPLGVILSLAAGDLMPALFGDAFEAASAPFALLIWSTALVLVNVNLAPILLAAGEDRRYAIGVSIAAAINVILNFALIPAFGTSGAAVATIAAELAILVYSARMLSRLIGTVRVPRGHILKILAASLGSGAVFLAVSSVAGLWAALALATAAYALAALLAGLVTPAEIRALRSQVQPRK